MERLCFYADLPLGRSKGFLGLWFRVRGLIDRTAKRESERRVFVAADFLGLEGSTKVFLKTGFLHAQNAAHKTEHEYPSLLFTTVITVSLFLMTSNGIPVCDACSCRLISGIFGQ